MLFKFEELYDAKPDYYAVTKGKVLRITSTQIELLGEIDTFKMPPNAKPMALDDWRALHLPVAIDFHYDGTTPSEKDPEPPEPERELTEVEERLDDVYEREYREWSTRRMEQAAEVLVQHREDPIFVTSKVSRDSQEYSCPLLVDALTALLRGGSAPIDPIGWRRRQPSDTANLANQIAEIVNGVAKQYTQVMAAKQAVRTRQVVMPPSSPPPPPPSASQMPQEEDSHAE